MGKDAIADIITSIRNANMSKKKGVVRIASTNITENIVKILLRESFIEMESTRSSDYKVISYRTRGRNKVMYFLIMRRGHSSICK